MKIKRLILTMCGLLLSLHKISAQITITSNDMPNVNGSIRISVNTSLAGFQANSTGPNYTWDYSKLIPDSQRVVKFVPGSSTPYTLFAFLASYGIQNYTPDQFPFSILGTPPTNVYDFYRKTSAFLAIVGQGLTVSGTPIPGFFSAADRVYKFPLNYLDKDSSNSAFSFPIPRLGYYAKKQKRVNKVDGWGTLITPYGTFNTLRVKSTLTIVDSIYLDTIKFGFTIPRALKYEYKWLGAGSKIPLLEIDATQGFLGVLTIDRVNWQDSIIGTMMVNFTDKKTCPVAKDGSISATVTGGRYPLTYLWSNGQTTNTISNLAIGTYSVTIKDRYGRQIQSSDTVKAYVQDASCLNIPTAFTPDGDGVNDVWKIRSLSEFPNCKVEIFNQWGSLLFTSTGYNTPWDGRYNGEPVSAGAYYYVISIDNSSTKFTGTVTVIK